MAKLNAIKPRGAPDPSYERGYSGAAAPSAAPRGRNPRTARPPSPHPGTPNGPAAAAATAHPSAYLRAARLRQGSPRAAPARARCPSPAHPRARRCRAAPRNAGACGGGEGSAVGGGRGRGGERERERRRGAAGRCKWLNAGARAAQKLRSPRGPRRARPLCFPAQRRAYKHGAGGSGSPEADLLRVAGSAGMSRRRGGNRNAAAAGRGARRPRGGEAGTAPPGRAEGSSPAEAPSGGDGAGGRLAVP